MNKYIPETLITPTTDVTTACTSNSISSTSSAPKGGCSVVRPPDIVVGGLIFYQGFFLSFFSLSSFFTLQSPSSLNGTQPKSATWSEGSAVWKRMSEIWDIPSMYKSKAQIPPFGRLLNRKFNGLYLWNETRYRQSVKCFANYKESPVSSQKWHELWSTNGFTLDGSFYPPSVNSALHFIARFRRRRSANGTQPNFVSGNSR